MGRTIRVGDKVRAFLHPVKGVVVNISEQDVQPSNYYSVGTSTKVFIYEVQTQEGKKYQFKLGDIYIDQ